MHPYHPYLAAAHGPSVSDAGIALSVSRVTRSVLRPCVECGSPGALNGRGHLLGQDAPVAGRVDHLPEPPQVSTLITAQIDRDRTCAGEGCEGQV